jgi:3-deoxy-D-manno-octulosonate 8-phosphate phosphatase (KDO 8-P phosphatase)
MGIRMASEQQIGQQEGLPEVGIKAVLVSTPIDIAITAPVEIELVHLFDKLRAVKAFVFDVDGVFTNNTIQVTETGELLRTMNVRDGQSVKWAIEAGYMMGVITGGRSEGTKKRLTDLGIAEYYSGVKEKLPAFHSFLERTGMLSSEVCYMGDDMPDLPVMRRVIVSACPADSVPEVIEISDYISPLPGGAGCVRDIIEKVMKIQGKWPEY